MLSKININNYEPLSNIGFDQTLARVGHINRLIDEINAGSIVGGVLTFFLNGNATDEGTGTLNSPFKTLTALNNKILTLDPNNVYSAVVAPYAPGYGNEVVGTLNIASNLSLIGVTPQNTGISCNLNLVAPGGPNGLVNQYRQIAFNGIFTMDLTLASFASISFQNGAVNLNRVDNNPAAFIVMQGGIGPTSVSGTVLIQGGVMFGNINVAPGSTLLCTNVFSLGGVFALTGNCVLKTLSGLNPTNGYVDGTTDGSGTPTWLTDASSNATFTGTVTKTVY